MPEQMPEQYPERQVAVKLRITEINSGEYVVEEGWKPNYLLTKEGKKVSRVNLTGVVLEKEEKKSATSLVLDDGSGQITVRSFEEIKRLKDIKIGEGILVVGKIRTFNNERYISPEIIRKVDMNWLKMRRLELEKERAGEAKEEVIGKRWEEETNVKEEFFDPAGKKIIMQIRELDKGEGASIEEVKEKLKIEKAEETIEKLLKDGEIFQNLPGRIKVL